ncbi:3D domain-containing protein [Psychroserpens sp. SPM9]|uniref:3D domain-containing protein n=1 Tax=Psychroserpens sp. SPM9 TaxID=2975598 RepID=UPI0021A560D6|nr:3D domain-containing protein [Psychroserpens sp. SPM9]MDG5491975.1 3D domain-containing protein [Psychroserpens sp. SPM9]
MNSSASYIKYVLFGLSLVAFSCKNVESTPYEWVSIEVTATAYNSLAYQTNSNPHITAFGDSLKPGLRYIAVSRDLLKQGLEHNTLVKVEGLEGTYLVKDKMNRRWRNRIDIYMGTDVNAAKQWGRRKVNISYRVEIENDTLN